MNLFPDDTSKPTDTPDLFDSSYNSTDSSDLGTSESTSIGNATSGSINGGGISDMDTSDLEGSDTANRTSVDSEAESPTVDGKYVIYMFLIDIGYPYCTKLLHTYSN